MLAILRSMLAFLIRVVISAVAIYLTSRWISGVELLNDGTTGGTVLVVGLVGAVLTVVNMIIRPIVKIVSLPLYLLTLGLFFVVVNGAMLMLTSWITSHFEYGLTIESFGTAIWASLFVSLISLILTAILPSGKKS